MKNAPPAAFLPSDLYSHGVSTNQPNAIDASSTTIRAGKIRRILRVGSTTNRFVAWTATAPAKIYWLYPRKGSIAVGGDADIAIWDPNHAVTFGDPMVVDRAGYTPYAGRTVKGWPIVVIRRGAVIVEHGELDADPGSGHFLARAAGAAAVPLGRKSPEFDPRLNF